MREARDETAAPVRQSRYLAGWLALSFIVPFAILIVLTSLHIRLGQGYFAYRYSPVRNLRDVRAVPGIFMGIMAAAGVLLLARSGSRKKGGAVLLSASLIAAMLWAWWAPPAPLNQQVFNLSSFSSDGAFVFEAEQISSLGDYLRHFPQRLATSVREMRGTRVLSNPPGMTMLSYGVIHALPPRANPPGWLERMMIDAYGVEPDNVAMGVNALHIGAVLMLIWGVAILAAYGLGRMYLSAAGAAVFATIACFNPCTVLFVPGKDPAQLLFIILMLWAWLAGVRRRSAL